MTEEVRTCTKTSPWWPPPHCKSAKSSEWKISRETPTANQVRRADGRRGEVDNAMQYNAIRCNEMQCNAMQWRGGQCSRNAGMERETPQTRLRYRSVTRRGRQIGCNVPQLVKMLKKTQNVTCCKHLWCVCTACKLEKKIGRQHDNVAAMGQTTK